MTNDLQSKFAEIGADLTTLRQRLRAISDKDEVWEQVCAVPGGKYQAVQLAACVRDAADMALRLAAKFNEVRR